MNKYKFSLANVILVLTAVVFGFVCFLGANFYTLGDTKKSLIIAGIVSIILASLAFLAKWFKSVQGNFKINRLAEIFVLFLFTMVIAILTYSPILQYFKISNFTCSPFSHYFTVSEREDTIKNQLSTTIKQTQNMFDEYESYANKRKISYENTLKRIVKTSDKLGTTDESKEFGFQDNEVSYEVQAKYKVLTIQDELFPNNYTDTISDKGIKEVANNWLIDAQEKTKGWKPIGIVGVVKDIEQKSIGWQNNLIGFSTTRQKGEKDIEDLYFEYPLSFENVKANFTTVAKPTPLAIFLAVLAWALMLLSWFITKRSSKIFGRLATYEVEL